MTQAARDLRQAGNSANEGLHEWACFAAQQGAEKAVRGLHQHVGQAAWGSVVRRLLEDPPAGKKPPGELIEAARVLDAFYVPTRYPNGHPAGAPAEHYGSLQSKQAMDYAGQIVEFCRLQMA